MIRLTALALATALLAGAAPAQDRIALLRARLEHEPSPVAKAKLMPALGDAEFAQIDVYVTQEQLAGALALLQAYRDEVNLCDKGLDATGANAEKHPGGFKQLQFSLRESLRRLEAELAHMTADEQVPFIAVRQELTDVNRHLIQQLFPGESPGTPEPAKPEH
jgi:hypothetical protein